MPVDNEQQAGLLQTLVDTTSIHLIVPGLFRFKNMAHFAQLDENNIVTAVLAVGNDDIQNLPFPQSESLGVVFLNSIFPNTVWKQTSYNNNFRVRYAGMDMVFHPSTDTYPHGYFVHQKPYEYFVWDNEACDWIPPEPYPTTGRTYFWSHEAYSWIPNGPVPFTQIGE